jgi:uncharacterized protein with HEPN domain
MPHRIKKLLTDISLSIGEALNRLYRIDKENIENRISEYRNIVGLRNIIAHGYDIVDVAVIWDVVRNQIPVLKREIKDY